MKKTFTAVIAVALALTICGCNSTKKEVKEKTKYQALPGKTQTQEQKKKDEQQNQQAPEKVEPQVMLNYTNPLTGEKCERDLTNVRPVAIMLNNLHEALPQLCISEAEILYEVLEEGGITRLLGIYNDFYLMDEIGSVRSARDYYIDLADSHDAVFVHAGRSTYADTALKQRRTNNIDGLYSGVFYRSPERLGKMAYEHTLMTTGYGIYSEIARFGYRATSQNQSPLVFSENYSLGTKSANYIKIPFSIGYTKNPYAVSFFDYDKASGKYLKGHFEQTHIDGDDGEQLSFKNVITLTCGMNRIAGDALGCIQVHFYGQGTGTYSVDGTTRDIIWKKTDRQSPYTLYESDGVTPLEIAQGKSYIALVPTGTNLTIE